MPESAILKKRGLGYGRKIPPINFRISGDQLAELEAEVVAAKKIDKKDISVNEAARRRCFPGGPKLIRIVHAVTTEDDPARTLAEGLTLEEVLRAPGLIRFSRMAGFVRWSVSDDHRLMAEFTDGTICAGRVAQGQMRGLPTWKGKTR